MNLTVLYILREPVIQTIIARAATTYLTKKLHTRVNIEGLAITSLQKLSIKNILIMDLHNDTLVFSSRINLKLEHPIYKTKDFAIENIQIDDAHLNLIKYKSEESSNLQFLLDFFSSGDTTMNDSSAQKPFFLHEISISNSSFSYLNQNYADSINGINFDDVEVSNLNTHLKDLDFQADTFKVEVVHLSLFEKSGFNVDSLSCIFSIGKNFMQVEQLKILTPFNDIDLDFIFSYNSIDDFQDFINLVQINATLRPSLINLDEVGFFAPVMYTMDNRLRISGNMTGTVANFKARNFKFALGKKTQFRGDIQMTGLPDVNETYTHLSIKEFTTSADDISHFRLPAEPVLIPLPEILNRLGTIKIEGKFTGFYNDFVSYANFKTALGKLKTDLLLKVNKKGEIAYDGHFEADRFDAGKFLDVEETIGKLNIVSNVKGSGFDFETMQINMDGVVDSLEFYKNIYNEINIHGNLSDKKFTGQFAVKDDFLDLDFTGSLDYSQTIPAYNFSANIPYVYLEKINLINGDESSKLSTTLTINILGDELDIMQGIIQLDSTVYSENDKKWLMNDFMLSITRESDNYSFINLYSDLLDASLEGDFKLMELKERGMNLLNLYLDKLIEQHITVPRDLAYQDFIFSVKLKNTAPLSELFYPKLEIKPGTFISGGYNSQINNLFFDGKSSEITFMDKKVVDWYIDFYMQDSSALLNTGARKIVLTDTIQADSLQLFFTASNDTLDIHALWVDKSENPLSSGDFKGQMAILDSDKFTFHFDQADFRFSETLWQVDPSNLLSIDSNRIQFNKMGFSNNQQGIYIQGGLSTNPKDTIEFGFRNFDLSNFDLLLQHLDIELDGYINGGFKLIDYYNSPFYLSDIHIDSLKFNKEKLGEAELLTSWDPGSEAFDINGSIIYTGNIGQSKTLGITGNYYPARTDNNFNIDLELNKYKLVTLRPFVNDFSSEIEGMATGNIELRGSVAEPQVTGKLNLIRCALRIDYTNVKYFFADQVIIEPNDIHFENIEINDSIPNRALLSGHIYHNHLKDFYFDLNFNTNQIIGLNTSRHQNSIFYGHALTSGTVSISGPVRNLNMSMDIRSEKGTDIKIPVSYGTEVGNNDYIVFVNEVKNEGKPKVQYKHNDEGVSLQLGMELTNDANIQLFMPYNMGNIRAKGNGDMRLDVDVNSNFTMDGEYIIDRGSFFFTLQNILNRTFDIKRGSKISWTGDPYNAQINMKAIYKVKTNLGEYGPPQDSSTRVPVDCIIELRNQLLNPDIRFSIEFPDISEDSKQYIYARLDTNDQAMMSQQMISLLVLNSFSSSSGYSGNVGFNTFSLVTNQLNNWLSSISRDFDIGVNYRPGNELSTQEVEVALSTQLWNDRVLIDGNVGMKDTQSAQNTTSTQNTNSIVGEVNVEVKITPDGRFRAKAFNKSNNNDLYKNYSPYTQGVGIFYTQEFNKLIELFPSREKNERK